MSQLEYARSAFMNAAAALRQLERTRFAVHFRGDPVESREHDARILVARQVLASALEEYRLAKMATPPRHRPVRL